MTVARILEGKNGSIFSLAATDTIEIAAKMLTNKRIGALPIMQGDKLAGILSERDIVRGLATRGAEALAQTIEALMTHSVITCQPSDSLAHVMQLMTDKRIRHLPVLSEGLMIDIISIGDVVKARLDEAEEEAKAMKHYIASA